MTDPRAEAVRLLQLVTSRRIDFNAFEQEYLSLSKRQDFGTDRIGQLLDEAFFLVEAQDPERSEIDETPHNLAPTSVMKGLIEINRQLAELGG